MARRRVPSGEFFFLSRRIQREKEGHDANTYHKIPETSHQVDPIVRVLRTIELRSLDDLQANRRRAFAIRHLW